MARPCPIKTNTRMVLAKSGTDATLDIDEDRIAVTEVEITFESEEIDRSDVYTPNGLGMASIPSGIDITMSITQEVYPDFYDQHMALMASCPVLITNDGIDAVVEPTTKLCEGDGFEPVTIEVVEVGGNVYRLKNGTGTFSIAGEAGQRLMITFEITGEYVSPKDTSTEYNPPYAPADIPMVLLYKDSVAEYQTGVDEQDEPIFTHLLTCPSFTFEPDMDRVDVESACKEDGRGFSYVVGNGPAVLSYDGVLAGPNSKDKVWDLVDNPPEGWQMRSVFARDKDDNEFYVVLDNYGLQTPESADVEGVRGYNLSFQSGEWKLVWEGGYPE